MKSFYVCLVIILTWVGRAESRYDYHCFTDQKMVSKRINDYIVPDSNRMAEALCSLIHGHRKPLLKEPGFGHPPNRKALLFRLKRGLLMNQEVSSQTGKGSPSSRFFLSNFPSWIPQFFCSFHSENDALLWASMCLLQWVSGRGAKRLFPLEFGFLSG